MQYKRLYVLLTIVSTLQVFLCLGQVPDFSKAPNVWPEDSASITELVRNGTNIKKGKVIAWFPADSLDEKRLQGITDTLNMGIGIAEKILGMPHQWQVHQGKPYTFYFRKDRFISHASFAGFVSIPFWRIREGKAPWLHEAIHEMLHTKTGSWLADSVSEENALRNRSLWLDEGLPEYVSMKAFQQMGLPLFAVLSNVFYKDIDSLCKASLATSPRPDYILSFIGAKGTLRELFDKERMLYAPSFYNCSCSFVKFVAENNGLQPLLQAVSVFGKEQEELEKAISAPLPEKKKAWLKKLNIEQ